MGARLRSNGPATGQIGTLRSRLATASLRSRSTSASRRTSAASSSRFSCAGARAGGVHGPASDHSKRAQGPPSASQRRSGPPQLYNDARARLGRRRRNVRPAAVGRGRDAPDLYGGQGGMGGAAPARASPRPRGGAAGARSCGPAALRAQPPIFVLGGARLRNGRAADCAAERRHASGAVLRWRGTRDARGERVWKGVGCGLRGVSA